MVHIYNYFSTDIYKDVIFIDARKLEAKERDLKYREITFKSTLDLYCHHPGLNPQAMASDHALFS